MSEEEIAPMSTDEVLDYVLSGQMQTDELIGEINSIRDGMFDGVCDQLAISSVHSQRGHLKKVYNDLLNVAVRRFEIDVTRIHDDQWTRKTLIAFNSAFIDRINAAMD